MCGPLLLDGETKKVHTVPIGDNERPHKYLNSRYGKFTTKNLKENKDRMDTPIETYQPISVYFTIFDDAIQFANDSKKSFTTRKVLQTAFLEVLQKGEYNYEFKEWNQNSSADKSWSNVNTFFADAYQDLKQHQELTVKHARFYMANAAVAISTALDNPAMGDTANRDIVAKLTNINAKPVATNESFTDQLKKPCHPSSNKQQNLAAAAVEAMMEVEKEG